MNDGPPSGGGQAFVRTRLQFRFFIPPGVRQVDFRFTEEQLMIQDVARRIAREKIAPSAEHFDRVSDVVRRYLGDRYGFDGLESTTREMLGELRRTTPRIPVLDEIERFLRQADLVKFARLTPTEPECSTALNEAQLIVERTVPPATPAAAAAPAASAGPDDEEPQDG